MPLAASIFDEPTLTPAARPPAPIPTRRTYRGRRVEFIDHKGRHELWVDGVVVPVLSLGPRRFSSWALPGGRYSSLEELGRALVRAYFAVPSRARVRDDVGSDSFELPED